ncbi:MAG: RNase adapter RapZ [Gammaproteobacteria bacterium]|nr:RNase adapter RapZ [Gammaproteobacteria bacterium]
MKLVIISGLSGSGKSIALHTLEDSGYYCIDNLPVSLLENLALQLSRSSHPSQQKAAASIDARNVPDDLRRFNDILRKLDHQGINCELLYLHTEEATLLKRFSETRRRHPLSDKNTALADAIKNEIKLLAPIAQQADLNIDTTHTTIHQLRDIIHQRIDGCSGKGMSILFQSFGFKNGVPGDTDFVFDARCLPNPHWEPELRIKTGRDHEVIEYLSSKSLVNELFNDICHFMDKWIPQFQQENRSYLSIAIGCTGGKHRSVYLVEALGKYFSSNTQTLNKHSKTSILIRHRDLT